MDVPTLAWDLWRDSIIPNCLDESTSFLQAVLKILKISPQYRRELNIHITALIHRRNKSVPPLSELDRLFLVYVIFGTLKEVQNFVAKHQLSFEYLKTLQPIKTHIQRCEEKLYNCDLIRWFIENGLDARGSIIDQRHIEYHPPAWNTYLLENGATCEISDMCFFKSVADFSRYWKYCNIHDTTTISKLVSNIFALMDKHLRTNERTEFIMQQFSSADSDNYFKKLPLELIQTICSYELDEELWMELSDVITKHAPNGSLKIDFGYSDFSYAVPRFVWRFWDKFSDDTKNLVVAKIRTVTFRSVTEEFYDSLLKFLRLPIMANAFPNPETHVAPSLLDGAVYFTHPKAILILKAIVETQPHLPKTYRCANTERVPAVWDAMLKNNTPVIEYLISIDSWPMVSPWGEQLTLEAWATRRRATEVLPFVYECRKKYNMDLPKE